MGFAELSDTAIGQSGVRESVPTPTVNFPVATVSATSRPSLSGAASVFGSKGKFVFGIWVAVLAVMGMVM